MEERTLSSDALVLSTTSPRGRAGLPLPIRTRVYPSSALKKWPKSDISDFGGERTGGSGFGSLDRAEPLTPPLSRCGGEETQIVAPPCPGHQNHASEQAARPDRQREQQESERHRRRPRWPVESRGEALDDAEQQRPDQRAGQAAETAKHADREHAADIVGGDRGLDRLDHDQQRAGDRC